LGIFDRLKAAASVAANAAKEAVGEQTDAIQRRAGKEVDDLESHVGEEGWYQGIKRAGGVGGEVASGVLQGAANIGRTIFEEAGRTELGRGIGASTREVTSTIGTLPIVSAVSDARRALHGVDALGDHLREDPSDPERFLWLAEALEALSQDRDRAVLMRALLNPTALLKIAALRTTRSLGREGEDARRRLLKSAFVLTVRGLQACPTDARLLHVMARVYLAVDDPREAMRFAKLAVLAAPEDGAPLVTLARIYLSMGQRHNGRQAARLAAERGCTVGFALLADVVLEDAGVEPLERLKLHGVLIERIEEHDMLAYYGPRSQGFALVGAVGRAQWSKIEQFLASQQPVAAEEWPVAYEDDAGIAREGEE